MRSLRPVTALPWAISEWAAEAASHPFVWLDLPEEAYFTKDAEFDAQLTERFGEALKSAKSGEFDHWADTVDGALALVILLDQFSRNIFRIKF